MPERRLTTHDIAFAAASVALLAVSAWVTVPIGPVPFTLQTMALAFLVGALTPRRAAVAILTYVLLGAIGLPVFSGMRGGLGVVLGPTGGFILGFVPAVVAACAVLARSRSVLAKALAAALVIVISYALGWLWLMVSTGMDAGAAFAAACAPFIVPDIAKVAVGMGVAEVVATALPQLAQEG